MKHTFFLNIARSIVMWYLNKLYRTIQVKTQSMEMMGLRMDLMVQASKIAETISVITTQKLHDKIVDETFLSVEQTKLLSDIYKTNDIQSAGNYKEDFIKLEFIRELHGGKAEVTLLGYRVMIKMMEYIGKWTALGKDEDMPDNGLYY